MNSELENDLNELSDILDEVKYLGLNFLGVLDSLPTFATDQQIDSFELPNHGHGQ